MGTGHSSKKNVSIIINYLFIYYFFILEFQAELNGSMGHIQPAGRQLIIAPLNLLRDSEILSGVHFNCIFLSYKLMNMNSETSALFQGDGSVLTHAANQTAVSG